MERAQVQEQAILAAALKLPPKERADYLDRACGEDLALRERIIQAVFAASGKTAVSPNKAPPQASADTVIVAQPEHELGEQPGEQIGRYKLLEKLGEGGMGSVWVAEEREVLHRQVALKLIKPGMDTRQVIARFENERRALALMDHPHIAKIFDAGSTPRNRPFFAMELVRGLRITDYCDRQQLPTRERLLLFTQVCDAIQHAHAKGILHRDIKPANILVTVQQGPPAPRIIDFGIAKAMGGQPLSEQTIYTSAGEFIGTPAYISPEQAEMDSLSVDARSDIYSLGVLLYELLTGVTPFESERLKQLGLSEIRRIIREEEPVPPSTRLTRLGPAERDAVARHHQCDTPKLIHLVRRDLDWVVMKCLEKDRTRRYDSARALAQDLERHLANQPVMARPPSAGYRLRKWTRRNQALVKFGVGTVLLAGLLAGLALVLWPGRNLPEHLTAEAWLSRADTQLEQYDREGRIAAAKRDLNDALKDYPDDARLLAKLGWANWLLFEDEESEAAVYDAERFATNALRANPKEPLAHLVAGLTAKNHRDWPAATNHLAMAVAESRSDGLALVSLAAGCLAAGDITNAVQYAQQAEESPAHNWMVLDRAGVIRIQSRRSANDLAAALHDFEQAVSYDRKSPLAHRHLAQALLLQQQPESVQRAQAEFKAALALRRNARTLGGIGSAYLAVREYATAAKHFREAIAQDPSKYVYHLGLGLSLFQANRQDPEAASEFHQALSRLQDILSTGPEKPRVRAEKGLCHAALGEREMAVKELDRAESEAAGDKVVLGVVREGRQLLEQTK